MIFFKFFKNYLDYRRHSLKDDENISNECAVLQKIKSPFVVKYYQHFIDGDCIVLIMEYAEKGSLRKMINVCNFYYLVNLTV